MAGVQSRLRELRQTYGFTQEALARASGVTRQTVGAIEAGDYGPSLDVALRLARAFGVPVEEIFSLEPSAAPDAALAGGPGRRRVVLARIGGRDVLRDLSGLGAYRWPTAAADGVAGIGEDGRVELHRLRGERERPLFLAGCDPALGLLAEHLQAAGVRAYWFEAGSGAAIEQLVAGRTHIAAVHWRTGAQPPAPPADVERLELSRWRLGFVVRRGGPAVHGAADLGGGALRLVNRERGAGARSLLDRLLAEEGLDPARVAGYAHEVRGHWEVADAVAQGAADVGIATEAAANAFALAFLPLTEEICELWSRPDTLDAPWRQRLGDTLSGQGFRRDLAAFGPYDIRRTGVVPAHP